MNSLLVKFKSAFEIPFDPSDETSNREAIVSGLLNIGITIACVYLIPITLARGFAATQTYIALATFFFFIILRIALSKGYTTTISLILLLSFWGVLSYEFLFLENGLRAPAYTASLAFIIVYAGLLYGRRIAWTIAGISLFINLLVLIGELKGIYLTKPNIPDIRWAFFGQLVFFSGIIFMLTKTLQNLSKSISLFRDESEKRHRSELEVKKAHKELELAYKTTLEGWANALELRDKETEGHSRRVTDLAVNLAREIGLDKEALKYIFYGALLHDIGKMGIPDEILNKPGPLTPEEREIINQHPTYAYNMLKNIEYLEPAVSIPYSHHENWDGTGYPQGLKGKEIPLPARIFKIIDNWDALKSDRPYRKPWPRKKVIKYLQDEKGNLFDPKIVEVFIERFIT